MTDENIVGKRGNPVSVAVNINSVDRPSQPMRSETGEVVDYFKFRTASQAFMNEFGVLFDAMAREAEDPSGLIQRGSLSQAIEATSALALETARLFTGKQDPLSHEIRPFRQPSAQVIASHWQDRGLRFLDIKQIAAQHAAAMKLVDENLDRSIYQDVQFSDESSLAMTASSVAQALMAPVMVYDFRRDPADLIDRMSRNIIEMSKEIVDQIVPEGAKPSEKRSVFQTTSNKLVAIMTTLYERKARQVVNHLSGLPEDAREAFARNYDPIPDIVRSFKEWGSIFAGASLAYARQATSAISVPVPEQDATPQRG